MVSSSRDVSLRLISSFEARAAALAQFVHQTFDQRSRVDAAFSPFRDVADGANLSVVVGNRLRDELLRVGHDGFQFFGDIVDSRAGRSGSQVCRE